MYDIQTARDIAEHRKRLEMRLLKDSQRVTYDANLVWQSWRWLFNIGSTTKRVINKLLPTIDYAVLGWSFFDKIFRRKKRH